MKQCVHFNRCGGCSALDVPYESQLSAKQQTLIDLFPHFTNIISPVMPSPAVYYYRNKVQLPFGFKGRGGNLRAVLGCYANDSHMVVDQKMCHIQHRDLSTIAWTIRDWVKRTGLSVYNERTHQGLLRHILLRRGAGTGEILIGLVTNGLRTEGSRQLSRLLLSMIEKRTMVESTIVGIVQNINTRDTNVVLGSQERVWWGRPYIKENLGTLRYKIGLSTFFQVNPSQIPQLYNEILRHVPPDAKVLDLYCGVGSIALWIAASCQQVTGIEENQEAVAAACIAAKLNNCTNAGFISGDVNTEINRLSIEGFSCAIVDPPRKGLGDVLLHAFAASTIRRIIYVSCDPYTLRRDIRLLAPVYTPVSLQGVDMFPHTRHIECVTVLDRR